MIFLKLSKKYMVLIILGLAIILAAIFWQKILDAFLVSQQKAYRGYYKITNKIPKTYNSRIDAVYFNSPSLNGAWKEFRVYVPKEYDSNPQKKFPVLFLLHGDPGNDLDWLTNTNLQARLDQMIANKQIQPMLAVFPDGNGPTIKASQYVNATTVDQNMEDYIVKDTLQEVQKRYRTINDRSARAIGGISSGGYGAANLGLRHNDIFSVILVYGGYYENWFSELKKTLGNNPQALADNSPMQYLPNKHVDPNTHLYLTIGRSDIKSLVAQNTKFDALLTAQNVPHKFTLEPGFHTWNAWSRAVDKSFAYMDQYLRHE